MKKTITGLTATSFLIYISYKGIIKSEPNTFGYYLFFVTIIVFSLGFLILIFQGIKNILKMK